MPSRKKRQFTVLLPATPCNVELRDRILQVADNRGMSIAEVQREAFSLFLAEIDKRLSNSDNHLSTERQIA